MAPVAGPQPRGPSRVPHFGTQQGSQPHPSPVTAFWSSGFENQVAPYTNVGGGLCDGIVGTPGADTAQKRSGAASFKYAPAANTQYITVDMSSPSVLVWRGYFMTQANPTGARCTIFGGVPGLQNMYVQVSTGGVLQAVVETGTAVGSQTVNFNQWYLIDVMFDGRANPSVVRWRIDGVDQTSATLSQAATTFIGATIGAAFSTTATCWVDDAILSQTASDYPIGAGYSKVYVPTGKGTHAPGAGAFQDNTASAITDAGDSATQSWTRIDEQPPNTTDYVVQTAADANGYLEYTLGQSGQGNPPNAITVCSAIEASSAASCDMSVKANDAGTISPGRTTTTAVTTRTYGREVFSTRPSTGARWTEDAYNSLLVRAGYAVDATPNPRLDALWVEVDYAGVEPSVVNQTVNAPAATASASALTPTLQLEVDPAAATASVSAPAPVMPIVAPAATATASAPTPAVQLQVAPGVSTATASAPTPTPQLQVAPASATASASAPVPAVQLQVSPAAATATASAPGPVMPIVVPVATASANSPPATPQLQLTPAAATASASAPLPTVKLQVAPAAATATASAPAPVMPIVAPVATASASAPTPTLQDKVSPGADTATGSAPTPGVDVKVPPAAATASASAPLPTPKLQVSPAAATASASAPLPGVDVKVSPASATASASAPIPTVSAVTASQTVSPPAATATASALTPTVALQVAPAAATAVASAPTPTILNVVTVTAPAATAAAVSPTPTPALQVSPAVTTATASAPTPVDRDDIPAPAATASASAPAPTLSLPVGGFVIVPIATATASAPTPKIHHIFFDIAELWHHHENGLGEFPIAPGLSLNTTELFNQRYRDNSKAFPVTGDPALTVDLEKLWDQKYRDTSVPFPVDQL